MMGRSTMSNLIGDMARAVGAVGVRGLPTLKRAAGVVTRRVPIPQPLLLAGPGSAARLAHAVAGFGHRRVMLVTDAVIHRLGLLGPLLEALAATATKVVVFDEVTPDAPLPVVQAGLARFRAERCDAVLAVGGGSVIDAAKVIALGATNDKPLAEMAGYFRARHAPAPIYAVPTTAGTGSEVTVAAVIADPDAQRKLVIADTRLVPDMAALDPLLMAGLPPAVTAATGMDALTHAVEAYIGGWATPASDRMARAAVSMIHTHLPRAVADGGDLEAREQMALASTYAGLAFTRASVGNVHALAHQVGAHRHVPHGLANAILLPPVLRFSRPAADARLAQLARHLGLKGRGDAALAAACIDAVQALNDRIGIPRTMPDLEAADIPALATAACHEADFNYPVPRRMSVDDAQALLRGVLAAPDDAGQPSGDEPASGTAKAPRSRRAAGPKAAEPARPAPPPTKPARARRATTTTASTAQARPRRKAAA